MIFITKSKQASRTIYNNHGLILSHLRRYAEAIENYELGLKTDPSYCYLLYNKAVAMARWQGLTSAQTYIDIARSALLNISNDTSNSREKKARLYGLGGLEAVSDNVDLAVDYLQQAVAIDKSIVIEWVQHDIAWDSLRSNPQFLKLVSQHSED